MTDCMGVVVGDTEGVDASNSEVVRGGDGLGEGTKRNDRPL